MLDAPRSASDPRRRYRGLKDANPIRLDVHWGEARRIAVPADAIISITNIDGGACAWLTALTEDARSFSPDAIDLPDVAAHALNAAAFDSREMACLAAARNTDLTTARACAIFDNATEAGEVFVARMRAEATLFLIAPTQGAFIASGGGGRFSLQVEAPRHDAFRTIIAGALGAGAR